MESELEGCVYKILRRQQDGEGELFRESGVSYSKKDQKRR